MRQPTLSDILRDVHVAPHMRDTLARAAFNLSGGRVPFAFTTTLVSNLINAAESIVATTPPLNPPSDASNIIVIGMFQVVAGAAATFVTAKIRQGATVAGATVGNSAGFSVVAGSFYVASILAIDTPGLVAGIQYSMTGTATSGTANSNIAYLTLLAMAMG